MRFLLQIKIPNQPFNDLVRKGTAGTKLKKILDDAKPEAIYFSATGGTRGATMVVQLSDASKIPALAEPWFLTFDATIEFQAAMTPADLEKAGLDKLGAKWG